MAYSQNNVLIIPNVGVSTDVPQIIFTSSNLTSTGTITLRAYPNNNGTLSFEGSSGQLFSVNNSLVGTLFSVNDISGIPSITVADSGLVQLAPYNGYVTVGSNILTTGTSSGALVVSGGVGIGGSVYVGNTSTFYGVSNNNNYQQPIIKLDMLGNLFGGIGASANGVVKGGIQWDNSGILYIDTIAGVIYFNSEIGGETKNLYFYDGSQNFLSVTQSAAGTGSTINIGANGTASVSTTTGALTVQGGVGIGGNLYVGGTITANQLTIQYTTITQTLVTSPDIFTITNTTTSTNTITGALTVAGGVGIGGSVYVGNRVGFVNTANVSVVYQVYNPAASSLDFIFG